MTLLKSLAMVTTSLLGVALTAAMPEPAPPDDPPAPKEKKKEGPGGDLKKTYDILRRVRSSDHPAGRPEERLKDWAERASKFYREALKASEKGERRAADEFGAAAHDIARAIEHARNAASFGADDDLPPPPDADGPEETKRARRDLRHAYDRIEDMDETEGRDGKFYLDAARDLYNAARRDALAGRDARAGELARAAEALTHVPEHLDRAYDADDRPEPKKEKREPKEKKEAKEKREPKEKKEAKEKRKKGEPGDDIPPPIE